jgi:hypothetical protein
MLVSGEDSITRAGSLEVAGLEEVEVVGAAVAVAVELVVEEGLEPPLAVVEDELEQAARPAARRPVAVSASTLLLVILLIVNLTFPSGGNAIERRAFP